MNKEKKKRKGSSCGNQEVKEKKKKAFDTPLVEELI
jgi:hypothetical protein